MDRRGDDECWLWRGPFGLGYGLISRRRIDGRRTTSRAHRVAWSLWNEMPVPDGFEVMHTCDTPACCNPKHLELGTHAANMADRDRKGRHPRAAYIGAPVRLTAEKVREIRARRAAGETYEALALAYGVTPMSIENCVVRRTWKHVA